MNEYPMFMNRWSSHGNHLCADMRERQGDFIIASIDATSPIIDLVNYDLSVKSLHQYIDHINGDHSSVYEYRFNGSKKWLMMSKDSSNDLMTQCDLFCRSFYNAIVLNEELYYNAVFNAAVESWRMVDPIRRGELIYNHNLMPEEPMFGVPISYLLDNMPKTKNYKFLYDVIYSRLSEDDKLSDVHQYYLEKDKND